MLSRKWTLSESTLQNRLKKNLISSWKKFTEPDGVKSRRDQAKEIFKQSIDDLASLGDGKGFLEARWSSNSKISSPTVIGSSKTIMKAALVKCKAVAKTIKV